MKQNPSDFLNFPWESITHKSEHETVAHNIMVILTRTGDTFRSLSYSEYVSELEKDNQFSQHELLFNEVIDSGYFKNADTAQLFSKSWRES